MDHLLIEGTKATPTIHFDPQRHFLSIKGESYPENAAKHYAPVFAWLKEYLFLPDTHKVQLDIDVSYFNSSSSKIFLNLFEILEGVAAEGKTISVNWYYRADDETSQECGEEFQEDAEAIVFNLVEREND